MTHVDKGNCSEENDEQNEDAKRLVIQIPFVIQTLRKHGQ
jgi:hypothetical protein